MALLTTGIDDHVAVGGTIVAVFVGVDNVVTASRCAAVESTGVGAAVAVAGAFVARLAVIDDGVAAEAARARGPAGVGEGVAVGVAFVALFQAVDRGVAAGRHDAGGAARIWRGVAVGRSVVAPFAVVDNAVAAPGCAAVGPTGVGPGIIVVGGLVAVLADPLDPVAAERPKRDGELADAEGLGAAKVGRARPGLVAGEGGGGRYGGVEATDKASDAEHRQERTRSSQRVCHRPLRGSATPRAEAGTRGASDGEKAQNQQCGNHCLDCTAQSPAAIEASGLSGVACM